MKDTGFFAAAIRNINDPKIVVINDAGIPDVINLCKYTLPELKVE